MSCRYGGQEYSEGSLICVNGRELRCRGEEWVDIGPCNQLLDEIPTIDEKNAPKIEPALWDKPPQSYREHEVFAEFFSIHKDSRFLYFKGAPTAGHLCANDEWVRDYRIPLDDVRSIGARVACRQPPTRAYRIVTFIWPDQR